MLTAKDRRGIWLFVCLGVTLVALFSVKIAVGSRPAPDADNCVGRSVASTVILIDRSEEISTQTLREIEARALNHILEHVQLNERVTVFNVSDISKRSLKPIVSLCRPQSRVSWVSRFYENPKMILKRFQERFIEPIRKAIDVLPENSTESPLAQAITDISLSEYLRGTSSSLLIFSDMLENTPAFSLYACASPGDVISRYRDSRRGAKERPEFHNTKVYLNLIPRLRQSAEALKCRDTLWVWFFGDNKGAGAGLEVSYLPGGEPMNGARKDSGR